ncbi:hypothetical protein K3G63_17040 [Hymenobacter sp. HSC-4F20]|uniref:hypothetical protein n=1 Tax=Hymenobacter sp. HSC-4F20 TaxID=2864135 RepID=UPI001C73BCE7|nr:hypothetical protein [Hymenobacter sp. HSC-4F20]MBX0292157.1 hypothetical protein [Hymenobacter sp. HSC-4F20]
MSRARFYPLAFLLVLTALRSQAQTRTTTSPASPQKELVVRVTLPTVVGLLGEYTGILRSKEKGKLKTLTGPNRPRSTSNPVLILSIPLPKLLADRKEDPAP